ncbi:acyltransferase domain-containing protein [Lichenicoccus sp.]|uniref:acyltransferase domain-containing protein n=1 Tax=Lichenicoccus sp. TaxID=2781899 RepID=UPI003D0AC94B
MSALALLCSGQGGQHAAMFALTESAPAAAPVFEAAAALLGADPRNLASSGRGLHDNRTAQILCCTGALALAAALSGSIRDARIVAGYSVGELAAWGIAGLLTPAQVLTLAAARAGAMDQAAAAAPGGLLAIRGLPRAAADALAATHGAHLAIRVADDHAVYGGASEPLVALAAAVGPAGGVAQRLPVAIAAHTKLMAPAAAAFGHALASLPLPARPPGPARLLSGIDGAAVLSTAAGRDKLAAQVAHTVDWQACLESCAAARVDRVLELGPGHALAAMASAALPRAQTRAAEAFRTLVGLQDWLDG